MRRSTGAGKLFFLWRAWIAVGLASVFVGCVTEPITGRKMPFAGLISEGQTNQMGADAYQEILKDAKISRDSRWNPVLQRVGERIARVVDDRMAPYNRPAYEWEFKLIDAPKTVNAFALPGGKVAFYTGILPICESEAGVAVVMGHEIGHAYAQHGRARVSRGVVSQYGLAAVQLALGGGDESDENAEIKQLALGALGVGVGLGSLAFDRGDESAADQIGLILMAEAGYDPREAVAFWERMDKLAGGGGTLEFLSTHPSHATRIADLKELMPEAVETYEKAMPK